MRDESDRPVLHTQVGDFAEVGKVPGEAGGVVSNGDGGDLQVHCTDAEPCHPQLLKLLYGFFVEGQKPRICSS